MDERFRSKDSSSKALDFFWIVDILIGLEVSMTGF